ncbi:LIM homeobox transcription factor 1-alpha [Diprion similis]|uniref:LIM homeobox transcription factor 1-alpha n=1 Tax=Diprion similis TaxID=362088 RepID=UPI001EF8AA86|nr:LIM homeobox transcription factor 1-alpha [Diprion similis]
MALLDPAGLGMGAMAICAACGRGIADRYVMRVIERSYHEDCLSCAACASPLAHSCFTRDHKLYCRADYDRIYGHKCLGCGLTVAAEELVMRAGEEGAFHLRCFVCVVCGSRLQKGDQFVLKQGQLFCRADYEKEVEMMQGYTQLGDFGSDELAKIAISQDGRRGPKRPRTILTTQQRRAFKASFEVSPKPCRKVRENLAKETGLSVRIVQVWFQNQRAKIKKIQKKQRQEGKTDKEMDAANKKISKEEEHNSCSDVETSTAEYLRTAEDHFLPVKEEVDPDDVFFSQQHHSEYPGADEKMNHLRLMPYPTLPPYHPSGAPERSLSYSAPLQGGPGIGLNPIDRLYSMHTSYFCEEDNAITE